jgi:cell division protein ZapA (FtsZ GTPase activity inhibitor)
MLYYAVNNVKGRSVYMAINIMKELQERMKKIEYVTMDSIEMINLFGSRDTNNDSERIDKIAEDVENILKKISSEMDSRKKTGELYGNEELLCAFADIYGLIYQMKESMTSTTGKPSKSQSAKTVDTIIDSIEVILDKKGIRLNSSENKENPSFESISYRGKTVKYTKDNM